MINRSWIKHNLKLTRLSLLLCAALIGSGLSACARADGTGEKAKLDTTPAVYNAQTLVAYKSTLTGDASRLNALLNALPYATWKKNITLFQQDPCSIKVEYDSGYVLADLAQVENTLRCNAVLILALVDDVEQVEIGWKTGHNVTRIDRYTRAAVQQSLVKDIMTYSQNADSLNMLINSLNLKLQAHPGQYTPAMSSTPGIRLIASSNASASLVLWEAPYGQFLTWDTGTGKIIEHGERIEVLPGVPVFWSPLGSTGKPLQGASTAALNIALYGDGQRLAEKKILINCDGTGYYTVKSEPALAIGVDENLWISRATTLDSAVSQAVKARQRYYYIGEAAAEGHLILEYEESEGMVKAFTLASFGWFGFENGIFTVVSGSGAIPTVITFYKDEKGGYRLLEYREPLDGGGYPESVKSMFPERLWDRVLKNNSYPELVKQQEEQAREYLQSIGRQAPVQAAHVKKTLPRINVYASNKLFAALPKTVPDLNNFPYWLGTKEVLRDGIRYVYETVQSSQDGYDFISFRQTLADGKLVKEYQYKIIGSEPVPIKGQN